MASVMKALESFDLHPKLVKDFAVRTKSGALVSIAAMSIAVLLFISELRWYWTTERVEYMTVEPTGRSAVLRINFDVAFPDMPCAAVSLDAMDASGAHSLDILHNVFKRRLDRNGVPFGASTKESTLDTLTSKEELLKEKQKAIAEGRAAAPAREGYCGPCYGAGEEGQCCDSCEEVRDAYRKKGWQIVMAGIEQCSQEGFVGDVQAQAAAGEGCNIYGHLEVPKVPGSFHFAPGHGMQHAYSHVHDLLSFTFSHFNISHRINALSFGAYYPGATNPIDGLVRMQPTGSGMHQYFVKLVPTSYSKLGAKKGEEIEAFQFSVTEHLRKLDPATAALDSSTGLLPGVFFNYEISPIHVRIEEQRRSFGHLITNVFSIIGGVFTVMGLVDALLHRGIEGLTKGAGRRKAGAALG